uniref:Uncharacterized protein n=1 Tax=Musa acuminata subsp. malaccensis TaxID=214687 RepID=A0A804L1F1_MUSAM
MPCVGKYSQSTRIKMLNGSFFFFWRPPSLLKFFFNMMSDPDVDEN